MNRKTQVVLIVLAICLACAVASASHAAELDAGDSGLAQKLSARFAGDRTGACVLAAVIDHEDVRRARVCAGTRGDGPPDWDAAMEIGSISKTMTAYLVADLVLRGRWSLDDPIARFLPAGTPVPRQGDRQILVRDLLTHSSGLPAALPGMASPDTANPYGTLTDAELLAALGRVQLTRPIGSQPEYSNFGMMLLSLAVARSDGGDLESAFRERLFRPLGMSAWIADPGAERAAAGHMATGHRTKPWTVAPDLAGVGMIHANLADMVSYARAALGDGPKSATTLLRTTEQPLAYGFGMNWIRRTIKGRDIVMHEGATGGFSSFLALDPAAHRAVVLLADTQLFDLGGLADISLSLLGLDIPVQAPRREEPASTAQQRALAGDYAVGPMQLRIWVADDGRLMAQVKGQDAFELLHDSNGDFYPATFTALLTPIPADRADAPVQRFAFNQGGAIAEARRIGSAADAPPVITNPAWRDWAGEFCITDRFTLRVFERDGNLMVQGTGQPAIKVMPVGPDRVEIREAGAVVEFERDDGGRVIAAVLHQNGQVLRGPRL